MRGFQGTSPDQPSTIMAAVKHFALYGAVEGGRDYNTVDMTRCACTRSTCRPAGGGERGFRRRDGALNSINGVPATSIPG